MPGRGRFHRADRFLAVTPCAGRFERDPDFGPGGLLGQRAVEFARFILRDSVVVRLTAARARRLPYVTDRAAAREGLDAAGERTTGAA